MNPTERLTRLLLKIVALELLLRRGTEAPPAWWERRRRPTYNDPKREGRASW